jgi:hypothetical protein
MTELEEIQDHVSNEMKRWTRLEGMMDEELDRIQQAIEYLEDHSVNDE